MRAIALVPILPDKDLGRSLHRLGRAIAHLSILLFRFQVIQSNFRSRRLGRAIAILPDHLHCVWTLPEGEADFSARWRLS